MQIIHANNVTIHVWLVLMVAHVKFVPIKEYLILSNYYVFAKLGILRIIKPAKVSYFMNLIECK